MEPYLPLQSDCHMYLLVNVSTAIKLFGTPICGWCGEPCGIRAYATDTVKGDKHE